MGLRLAGVLVVLLCAAPAAAQDEEARARALFDEARVAFDAGRFPEARAQLEASLALLPRAPTALNLARVQQSMGDVLDAEAMLNRLLDGELGALEPERRAQVEQLLGEVREDAVTLRVSVDRESRVTLDGADRAEARPDNPLELRADPGEHVVAARAEDGASARESIELRPGASQEVALNLTGGYQREDDVAESPWLWLGVGLLVAGGVVAAVLLATIEVTDEPVTNDVFPTATALRF